MTRRLATLGLTLVALSWPTAALADTVTLRLMSINTIARQHDTKPLGKENKGDNIDFKDLLQNLATQFGNAKGKPVAFDAGRVLYTTAAEQRLVAIATFPTFGTITYEGYVNANAQGDIVLPITGGTGVFEGAKGTVTIGPGDQQAPNTYRVTVPGKLSLGGALPVA